VVRERLATSLVEVHQAIFGLLFIAVVLLMPGGLLEAWSRLQRLALRLYRQRWRQRGASRTSGASGH
jgi:hypothetical protein